MTEQIYDRRAGSVSALMTAVIWTPMACAMCTTGWSSSAHLRQPVGFQTDGMHVGKIPTERKIGGQLPSFLSQTHTHVHGTPPPELHDSCQMVSRIRAIAAKAPILRTVLALISFTLAGYSSNGAPGKKRHRATVRSSTGTHWKTKR